MRHIELNNMVVMRDQSGFFQLHKDQEALQEFLREVREKSMHFTSIEHKIRYMIDHDYYENIYEYYEPHVVEEIYQLAYSYDFQFASYMAAAKFYRDYALRTNDRSMYLEHYPDRAAITALYLGRGDARPRPRSNPRDDGAAAAAGYADFPQCRPQQAGRDGVLFPPGDG